MSSTLAVFCPVEIPGIGPCEVTGAHEQDSLGRNVHRRGACSWNGGADNANINQFPVPVMVEKKP